MPRAAGTRPSAYCRLSGSPSRADRPQLILMIFIRGDGSKPTMPGDETTQDGVSQTIPGGDPPSVQQALARPNGLPALKPTRPDRSFHPANPEAREPEGQLSCHRTGTWASAALIFRNLLVLFRIKSRFYLWEHQRR